MKLLVDLMKKNPNLGAACGRIHPVGSAGILYWYQKFEYVIGHWLQKATEHILGCVMCSPGCFSLFRAKALMDDDVMRKYTTKSEEPIHFVQFDQVGYLLYQCVSHKGAIFFAGPDLVSCVSIPVFLNLFCKLPFLIRI